MQAIATDNICPPIFLSVQMYTVLSWTVYLVGNLSTFAPPIFRSACHSLSHDNVLSNDDVNGSEKREQHRDSDDLSVGMKSKLAAPYLRDKM